jgi:hypothetical protein
MPNDQFGRPISVGDTVIIKGEVTKVLDDPNFINCTVKLAQQMPPAGTEVNLQLNTAQLEKEGGAGGEGGKSTAQTPPSPQQPPSPPPAPHVKK